jgi:hypothetical protein
VGIAIRRADRARRPLFTRGGFFGMPVSGRSLANLTPAPVGNAHAVKHGGQATRKTLPVGSVAEAIFAELEQEAPLRDAEGGLPAADRAAVELLALCLCRIQRVAAWLEEHGEFDEKGRPRPVLEVERRLRGEARDHMRDLGLTPRARAVLGLTLVRGRDALTLAEAMSELDEGGDGA